MRQQAVSRIYHKVKRLKYQYLGVFTKYYLVEKIIILRERTSVYANHLNSANNEGGAKCQNYDVEMKSI